MATVNVNQGESIESALRRFKRKVMTEEIIKDAKKPLSSVAGQRETQSASPAAQQEESAREQHRGNTQNNFSNEREACEIS